MNRLGDGAGFFAKASGAVEFIGIRCIEEVMRKRQPLFLARFRGPDIHITKDLHGIRVDYFAIDALFKSDRKIGFTRPCWPSNRVEPGQNCLLLLNRQAIAEAPRRVTRHRGEESVEARQPADGVFIRLRPTLDLIERGSKLSDEFANLLTGDLRGNRSHEHSIIAKRFDFEAQSPNELRRLSKRRHGSRREFDGERRKQALTRDPSFEPALTKPFVQNSLVGRVLVDYHQPIFGLCQQVART